MSAVAYRVANVADIDRIAALHAESGGRNYRGAYSDAFLDGDVLDVPAGGLDEPAQRASVRQRHHRGRDRRRDQSGSST